VLSGSGGLALGVDVGVLGLSLELSVGGGLGYNCVFKAISSNCLFSNHSADVSVSESFDGLGDWDSVAGDLFFSVGWLSLGGDVGDLVSAGGFVSGLLLGDGGSVGVVSIYDSDILST
jgi:hypothetical protein